ncbi:hypothetical protein I3843_09G034800 [Carya illinoinensis]|uniref:Uncharacterized protein n=1 Tax=Carya illinoinensis TaxID=32201 RepID=A0A922J5J0_CARIL|nr:hypothetical protein I3760_09G034000 [Carya illinoinensis]KAG6694118.1 hypothetical protein I3842_09G034500 [Carya illinoinensis]KAG7961788.1 hypothetical protein I3843_09G034800 [Carya illinoinensis]
MAWLGSSTTVLHIHTLMVLVSFCFVATIMAQDVRIAPMAGLETGAGFSLPVAGAVICSSMLATFVSFLLH